MTVIQKAIISDFLKAGRQHMHKETAQEFNMWQGDLFVFACFVVFCCKGYMGICNGFNTRVTDGNTVGVPAEIINGIAKAVKGFFDVGNPGLVI